MLYIINIYKNLCNIGRKFIKKKRHSDKLYAMKILLSLLLFPMLVLAQPNSYPQGEIFEVQLSIDLEQQTISEGEAMEGMVAVFVKVEVIYTENVMKKESPANYIPKHLNSLSLVGSYRQMYPSHKHQEQLNTLLAANDLNRPTERSFANWLKTVPYENQMLTSVNSIPEGFGARVRL